MLRESAMCPDADKATFEDVGLHRYFNTNNLWINLPVLRAKLDACGGVIHLPLIKNKKTVNREWRGRGRGRGWRAASGGPPALARHVLPGQLAVAGSTRSPHPPRSPRWRQRPSVPARDSNGKCDRVL